MLPPEKGKEERKSNRGILAKRWEDFWTYFNNYIGCLTETEINALDAINAKVIFIDEEENKGEVFHFQHESEILLNILIKFIGENHLTKVLLLVM